RAGRRGARFQPPPGDARRPQSPLQLRLCGLRRGRTKEEVDRVRTRITDTIGRRALLGAGLSAAAGLWLVAVEAGGHGWLSRWLLVVLVGAPTAALLAPLATRLAARPARLEAAALVALAAAAAAALGALAAGVLDVEALEPVRGLLL